MKPIDLRKLLKARDHWEYFQIEFNSKHYYCSVWTFFPYLPNHKAVLVRPPEPLHINNTTVFYNKDSWLILRKGKMYYVSYYDGQFWYFTGPSVTAKEFTPPEWFKRILSACML